MWEANPHGAGVSWIEKHKVFFEKGLMTFEDLVALVEGLPRPYVVHTRIATVGGVIPILTHPFVIAPDSPLAFGGSAERLLFHNGHWSGWEDAAKELPPLEGDISDSRAMAHIMAHKGGKHLRTLVASSQRVVTVSKRGIRWFGPGWREFNGIWTSNTHWLWRMPLKGSRRKVTVGPISGTSTASGYRNLLAPSECEDAWDKDRARWGDDRLGADEPTIWSTPKNAGDRAAEDLKTPPASLTNVVRHHTANQVIRQTWAGKGHAAGKRQPQRVTVEKHGGGAVHFADAVLERHGLGHLVSSTPTKTDPFEV